MDQACLIYLVDDADDYRYLVQQVFGMFLPGHNIRFFVSGADLVSKLDVPAAAAESKPDVLVLDIDMPHMNGFQTLLRIKQYPDWEEVPVVMISNRDQAEYVQESYRLGANAFILKPLNLMTIKTVMGHLCEHKRDFDHLPGLVRNAGLA